SFINVLIYRSIAGQNWLNDRSKCECCHHQIAWYDLIPLWSYLWLQGKCRHCQERISVLHPVVEGLVGMLFVWWYFIGSVFFRLTNQPFQAIQPAFWLLAGILLLIIVVADVLYYLVPDQAVMALLSLTLMYRLALVMGGEMRLLDLYSALIGMVALVAG
ncbi:MAG TPA: hypothetical protein DEP87_01745, partial [Candidatus Pacebacteria bacterium]|nr:hypothetical protein [Candidatus Paceibacterota bacterium]